MTTTIALVDDHELLRSGLAAIVNSIEGYRVILEADNGQVLIQNLKNKPAPDIILLDITMPVMDGYEATTIIRNRDRNIPIIALTASASYGYLDKALKLGINDYVIKPFSPKELNRKLFKYSKLP